MDIFMFIHVGLAEWDKISAGFAFEKLIITRYTLSTTYDIVTDRFCIISLCFSKL